MTFDLPRTLDLLARTPASLDHLLRDTDPAWHLATEGPETWSPKEVVAHLLQAEETNWVPRAEWILTQGEARPFPAFDRLAQRTRLPDQSLTQMLEAFAEQRARSLATVRGWNLKAAQLARRGHHPALGPVTLRQLLATWAVHDLSHLAQIARVMAKVEAQEVGPWRAYLPILAPREP